MLRTLRTMHSLGARPCPHSTGRYAVSGLVEALVGWLSIAPLMSAVLRVQVSGCLLGSGWRLTVVASECETCWHPAAAVLGLNGFVLRPASKAAVGFGCEEP